MEELARDLVAKLGGDTQALVVPALGAVVLLVVAKMLLKGALKAWAISLVVGAALVIGLAVGAVTVAKSSCRSLETKDPRAYQAARCDKILGAD